MKKRLVMLLVLSVVLTALAPLAAMADHCFKCNASWTRCLPAATGGKPFCDDSTGVCFLSGTTCTGPHPLIDEPLAAEFTVVSVELLDERQAPASGTRVASLETTGTAHR